MTPPQPAVYCHNLLLQSFNLEILWVVLNIISYLHLEIGDQEQMDLGNGRSDIKMLS